MPRTAASAPRRARRARLACGPFPWRVSNVPARDSTTGSHRATPARRPPAAVFRLRRVRAAVGACRRQLVLGAAAHSLALSSHRTIGRGSSRRCDSSTVCYSNPVDDPALGDVSAYPHIGDWTPSPMLYKPVAKEGRRRLHTIPWSSSWITSRAHKALRLSRLGGPQAYVDTGLSMRTCRYPGPIPSKRTSRAAARVRLEQLSSTPTTPCSPDRLHAT